MSNCQYCSYSFRNSGCSGNCSDTCNAGVTWDACFGGDCIVGESCCFGGFCAADCAAPPSFVITNTSPADGSINLPRNAKIRFRTNLPINAGTVGLGVGGTFHVVDGGGVDIPGNITPITGRIIEYTPSGACPANICGATECLPGGEIITVTADNGILSVGGNNLTCNILNPCVITFTTSNVVIVLRRQLLVARQPDMLLVSMIVACVNKHRLLIGLLRLAVFVMVWAEKISLVPRIMKQ